MTAHRRHENRLNKAGMNGPLMTYRNALRCCWYTTGLLLGFAIGHVQGQSNRADSAPPKHSISISTLVRCLARNAGNHPAIRNITIYPVFDGKSYVTGEIFEYSTPQSGGYRAFSLIAPAPFSAIERPTPDAGKGSSSDSAAPRIPEFKSIREFLQTQSKFDHRIEYRYAWWASARGISGRWAVLGLLVAAGSWAVADSRLQRRWPKPWARSKFSRPETSNAAPANSQPDALRASQVEAIVSDLEAYLAKANPGGTEAEGVEASRAAANLAVSPLNGGPLEAAKESPEIGPLEYRGEFYPVAKPGGQREERSQR